MSQRYDSGWQAGHSMRAATSFFRIGATGLICLARGYLHTSGDGRQHGGNVGAGQGYPR